MNFKFSFLLVIVFCKCKWIVIKLIIKCYLLILWEIILNHYHLWWRQVFVSIFIHFIQFNFWFLFSLGFVHLIRLSSFLPNTLFLSLFIINFSIF